MGRTLVVDSSSIRDFLKFYIFDKLGDKEVYSKLTNFLMLKIESKEIIVIDKVNNEIYDTKYTHGFKEAIKPFIVKTVFLFDKVQDLIMNNRREDVIRIKGYSEQEIEQILKEYEEKHADLYLIAYCNYMKENNTTPILITEETFSDDKKIIEKIPTICKKENIAFQKVPYALFEIYKDELKFHLDVKNIKNILEK